jgi:acetyl-CoA carboxylase carboxyltransferase component
VELTPMSEQTADSEARRARMGIRDHIDQLADPGSFVPVNGFEGGYAAIDGQPVVIGEKGMGLDWALAREYPYVGLSYGRGAPLRGGRRNLGLLDPVSGMSAGPLFPRLAARRRHVPVVSAIVHHSFGDSSFFTGFADLVIQLDGTCLALTGPRVLAIGTSEQVTMEELGGTSVHRYNGQIDAVAGTVDELYHGVRRMLGYLPGHGGAALPLRPAVEPDGSLVATSAGRAVVDGLVDAGSFTELKPDYAPSLLTGFARVAGVPVGVVASNPSVDDGVLDAEACLKAARHVCTCDSFGLPLLLLVDTPQPRPVDETGRDAPVSRTMMLAQALQLAEVPKVWLVPSRAYGAGLLLTGPARVGVDLALAWPDAQVGYLGTGDDERFRTDAEPWAPDGLVRPEDTRAVVVRHLQAVLGPAPVARSGPLSTWPLCL